MWYDVEYMPVPSNPNLFFKKLPNITKLQYLTPMAFIAQLCYCTYFILRLLCIA